MILSIISIIMGIITIFFKPELYLYWTAILDLALIIEAFTVDMPKWCRILLGTFAFVSLICCIVIILFL